MPSEFQLPGESAHPRTDVATTSPPSTWEYLEAHAAHFAKMTGHSPPQLVMKEGAYRTSLALIRGTVPLDPGVIALLDPEEAAFYVAYTMTLMKATSNRLHDVPSAFGLDEETLPSTAKYILSVACGLILLGILWFSAASVIPGMYDRHYQVPRLAALLFLENAMIWIALTRYAKDRVSIHFREASRLTGNPSAGRSFIRKMRIFYRTRRGTVPLKGFRRIVANWEIYMSLPRE